MSEAEAGPPERDASVSEAAPTAPGEPGVTTPTPGVDLGRRRFFRQFASEVFQTAATVAGAATALQRSTAQAAGAILNPEAATLPPVADSGPPAVAGAARVAGAAPSPPSETFTRPAARAVMVNPTGFRSAFRVDDDLLVLVDQRRLPGELAELEVRSAVEMAHELREWTIGPGPAAGQAAGVAMALTASRSRSARPYGRRAILRAGATQLIGARPTSRYVIAAVERIMAAYEAAGEFSEDGDAVAGAIWAEAEAILREATGDLGRIGRLGVLMLPKVDRPVGILVRGAIGALAGGQVGTVLAVLRAAVDSGREVLVHVTETRPRLTGARLTAWELEQAGIPHVVVADGAAGWLLEAGRIDIVLVGAERIAANGDVSAEIGTYPLAVLAARHGVPFGVCAPLAAVDFAMPDGRAMPVEQGVATEVTRIGGATITPPAASVLNPLTDVTPHDLVTAIVTEEGRIRAPYESGLVAAWHGRTVRHGVPRTGGPRVAAPDGGAEQAEDAAPDARETPA